MTPRPAPRRPLVAPLLLLVAAAYAGALLAQAPATPVAADPAPVIPTEFSDSARKAYAVALKEARTLATQKEYDLALNRLDALAVERPREPQARFLKATILTEQGKDADATAQLVALAADFPELPEPHNNLAVLYGRKGQYDLARRELETAVAAAPDYAIGHENLGDVYTRLAAMQYEKVATLDKRGKTAPLKLKFVRDALAVNEPPPEAKPAAVAPAATTAAPATTSPAATAPAATSAPAPLVITPEAPVAPPAASPETKEIVK